MPRTAATEPVCGADRDLLGVDVHAHLFPQSAVLAERRGEAWFGSTFEPVAATDAPVVRTGNRRAVLGAAIHREVPEQRLARMDDTGVARQVVSLLPPLFRYELPVAVAAAAAREVNEEIAEMVRQWPDRFVGLATLPLQDTRASLEELERTVRLGLAGFAVGTHVAGLDLDAPELRPVFEQAHEHRLFVLCHPANPRVTAPLRRFYLSNVVGNPLETTLAFTSLVLGGVLDTCPDMSLCLAHGGGYVSSAVGRLEHAYRTRHETAGSARPPSEYLRSVYFDTLTHDAHALVHLVERVGADRILLGSDYPSDMGTADPVGAVLGASLSDADRRAILAGNIDRVLARRITPPPPAPPAGNDADDRVR